jgi:HlyD family secretion protein
METLERPSTNGRKTHTMARASADLIETVVLAHAKGKNVRWRALAAIVLVLALVAGVAVVRVRSSAVVSYETAPVVREDLVRSVTATGTVNPQNTIAVGTQESGTISEIDADFNSKVTKGEVLAKLDPTALQAALDQAEASLAQARAQADAAQATASGAQAGIGTADATEQAAQATAQAAAATARSNQAAIASAQSNVTKAQSALVLAQQTVARDEALIAPGYVAQSQLDADRSNLVAAQTALQAAVAAVQQAQAGAQASEAQAQASAAQTTAQAYSASSARSQAETGTADAAASEAAVAAAEANVATAQSNLSKTIITSPVNGTVIARSVSVGQTVAASLETPTLFSIAQDLDKMEVDLAVGEPDIGDVKPGDGVDFSVLAYPNQTFHGAVSQVRIDPTTTNNVVTYDVVVLVGNRSGLLLPGMTANANINVAKSTGSLVVPAAALTYQPAAFGNGTHHRRATGTSTPASSAPPSAATQGSPWGATTASAAAIPPAGSQGRVFVERNGTLQRVSVQVLLTSGTQAAVKPLQGTLAQGDAVVTADSGASAASHSTRSATAANPLTGGAGVAGATRGIH